MDNYLTVLYFELFRNTEEEKRLRFITDFSSDNEAVRNDQSISGCQKTSDLLRKLIKKYMEHLNYLSEQ